MSFINKNYRWLRIDWLVVIWTDQLWLIWALKTLKRIFCPCVYIGLISVLFISGKEWHVLHSWMSQIGKSLKRLDNHLSRYHKGVTRAMNDRQSLNLSHSNKSYVTCLLPHCGKDVLHLSHHLRNKHSNMKVNEYHSTVDQVQKAYQSEGTKRLEEEGNKNRTHAK